MTSQPHNPAAQNYLRTKVLTATPEQLQMMLYDGALRFGEQAKAALEAKRFDESFDLITRVQRIVTELSCTLRPGVLPDLCAKLGGLYAFAYKKLVEANVKREIEPLNEAMDVLRYQRETWAMLMETLGRTKAAAAASKLDIPGPDERMERSISLCA